MPKGTKVSAFDRKFDHPVPFYDNGKRIYAISAIKYNGAQAMTKILTQYAMKYGQKSIRVNIDILDNIKRGFVRFCIMGNSKIPGLKKYPTWYMCANGPCAKPVWYVEIDKLMIEHKSQSILQRLFGWI